MMSFISWWWDTASFIGEARKTVPYWFVVPYPPKNYFFFRKGFMSQPISTVLWVRGAAYWLTPWWGGASRAAFSSWGRGWQQTLLCRCKAGMPAQNSLWQPLVGAGNSNLRQLDPDAKAGTHVEQRMCALDFPQTQHTKAAHLQLMGKQWKGKWGEWRGEAREEG